MTHSHYDLAIIGGGSAGLTAAEAAHALGAKVLLIDKQRLGGDCLLYGCVPSKSLIHVARLVQQVKASSQFGLVETVSAIDMAKVSSYIQGVIQHIGKTEKEATAAITVKFGHVSFKSPTTLLLNGEAIICRNTLIATGSRPTIPHIDGLAEAGYLTNEDIFDLTNLPASLIIAGAGPVGVELAQSLARLGTKITLLQGPERILPREDPEVSATIASILQADGVTIHTNTRLIQARQQGNKKVIMARQGEKTLTLEAHELLLALGRRPNIEELNLEAAGVQYDAKGIHVNAYLQTTSAPIFALGDAIGGYLFTHVAAYQAGIAIRNALLPFAKKKINYRVIPWCTFTDPEAARVGLTPTEAQQQHKQVRVITFPWSKIDRAQTDNVTTGFIKLVLAGKKEELVGAHMVGSQAGELLGEVTLAMQQRLTTSAIMNTIHTYPTMHTGLQQAAFMAYLTGPTAANNRKIIQIVLNLRR